MRRPCLFELSAVGVGALMLASAGLMAQHAHQRGQAPPTPVSMGQGAFPLREEAIRLYAEGRFPLACERFRRAADAEPARAALRQDVARCFESWGWQTLRDNRPQEATLLFRVGLREMPDDPGLLRGLGVASIHEGRAADAVAPLELAVGRGPADAEVQLLLARLYSQRDEPEAAVRHLRAVLHRAPEHSGARELLDKVERERHVEDRFDRLTTTRFVIKARPGQAIPARRALLVALDAAGERVDAELGYRPRERLTVVLYDRAQFRSVTRAHGDVSAVFDGKIRIPLPGPTSASALERLVTHEYAHAAIHELSRGRAPRWLHEGLAQLLEGAIADRELRVPGPVTLMGIEALVGDAEPRRARAGYQIALWVTEDLARRGGMTGLRVLLERLGAGESMSAAVTRAYGLRAAELESQWRNLLGS